MVVIWKLFKVLKTYTDDLDIQKVDENAQIVFKASKTKMEIAVKVCNKTSSLKSKFCAFDGKAKRTMGSTMLISSIYHPFLQSKDHWESWNAYQKIKRTWNCIAKYSMKLSQLLTITQVSIIHLNPIVVDLQYHLHHFMELSNLSQANNSISWLKNFPKTYCLLKSAVNTVRGIHLAILILE